MEYQSERTLDAACAPGVRYTISRMSLARRVELTRRMWELAGKSEFLEAGGGARERLEAALLARQIDGEYLRWGLRAIEGLTIDGVAATPEALAASGPEDLCREVVAAIRTECGLSEEERKN